MSSLVYIPDQNGDAERLIGSTVTRKRDGVIELRLLKTDLAENVQQIISEGKLSLCLHLVNTNQKGIKENN